MTSAPVANYSELQVANALGGEGFGLELGRFRCLLRSDSDLIAPRLRLLYQDYFAHLSPTGFYDFRVSLNRTRQSFWKPWEIEFDWAGNSALQALPLAHAHPLFEWGLNWCVATASGAHTVIHSAVVERDGLAMVLPGSPGSGKSTLCAALALTDWRLLSDELTIISQLDGKVQPVPRPISLKNQSIDIIKAFVPSAELTPPVVATHKGAIAYARPPRSAVQASHQTAPVGYVVFPKFVPGAQLDFEPLSRAEALSELMENTFNVGLLGAEGFASLARAIADAKCYAVEYGDLASIVNWVNTTCRPSA
ncbi:HprK-related kinase A [Rhodoferax sp. U11-2br]|uniref:HprK-related kinase A n=1 Tax=Rhodoferax sp. U11-2br TaxID=2838878 RepID=UPI001BEA8413|nr:HprK-related kinase A [Rhodoferax sp. U11-2br]MBT3068639.1 HprK-related kinase A [Rhodoferax sp. U11-2br]